MNGFVRAAVNVAIWIGIFFLTIAPVAFKFVPESPVTSLLTLLVPTLVVIFLRAENKRTYAIWTSIFFAIPLMHAYVVQSNDPAARFYFEALGASLIGGLLGYGVIRGIDWATKRKVSAVIPRFGQYVLGVALYALVGIPLMQQQEREDLAKEVAMRAQANEVGILVGICDAVDQLKNKHCPQFHTSDDLKQVCRSQMHEFVEASMQSEMRLFLAGDSIKGSVENNRRYIDEAFEAALATGHTQQQACYDLETFLDQTFTSSWEKLSAAKASK